MYSICLLFELECGIAKGVEFREELRCRECCGGDDMTPLGISGRRKSCRKMRMFLDNAHFGSEVWYRAAMQLDVNNN